MWTAVACSDAPSPAVDANAERGRPDVLADLRADRDAARHPSDGQGRAWLADGPATVVAGSVGSWVVAFEVGATGVARGGAVSLQAPPFWDWSPAQDRDPLAPGFTEVRCTRGFERVPAMGSASVAARATEAWPAGTRCTFAYGAGAAGARADRFADRGDGFHVGVDGDGDGVRGLLSEPVVVEVIAGPAAALVAHLPSAAEPGSDVDLRVAWLDAGGNGPLPLDGAVQGRLPDGLDGPAEVLLRGGSGSLWLRAREPGIYTVTVRDEAGRTARSNPMVVRKGVSPILWADLHAHSNLSDGTGAPEDLFRYARDVAALDVVALTDHDHWGMHALDRRSDRWARIVRAAREATVAGDFLALPGYEYTHWTDGHRHVVWFGGEPALYSSLDPRWERTEALWSALDGAPALVIPHHPAGGPVSLDWSRLGPRALEPVVEVASVHGQSELRSLPGAIYDGDAGAFVSAHIQPERPFGFIGSGDGHDGHPGLTHIVGGKGGLAGVLASATDAASVLASLRARSVYATTGPRIVLRFSVGGLDMGAVAPASDEPVDAVLRVVGTEAIDRVDLVRRSGVVATVAGDGPVLHAEWRLDGLADDFVYVRVVQMDGMLAWSSPIIYAAAGAD